jgi:hypothetical protein
MLKSIKERSKNLPQGLSAKEFFNHNSIKIEVAKRLKSKGMLIPLDFDYSYKQFKKYYILSVKKARSGGYSHFYNQLKERIGKNDLKLSYTWHQFINSSYIRNEISKKLHTDDKQEIDAIIKAIESRDFANFKTMVYKPRIVKEVNKIMYSREDFKDGGKASKIGDDAIKLLYIPPFALLVSIIALLLNIVTVIGMLITLVSGKYGNYLSFVVRLSLYVLIVMLPSLLGYSAFLDNDLMQKVSQSEFSFYVDILNWLSYYEQLNAGLHFGG